MSSIGSSTYHTATTSTVLPITDRGPIVYQSAVGCHVGGRVILSASLEKGTVIQRIDGATQRAFTTTEPRLSILRRDCPSVPIVTTTISASAGCTSSDSIVLHDKIIHGDVRSIHESVELTNCQVDGSVLASDKIKVVGGTITDNVSSTHESVTLSNCEVLGSITASDAIILQGVKVRGDIRSIHGTVTLINCEVEGSVLASDNIKTVETDVKGTMRSIHGKVNPPDSSDSDSETVSTLPARLKATRVASEESQVTSSAKRPPVAKPFHIEFSPDGHTMDASGSYVEGSLIMSQTGGPSHGVRVIRDEKGNVTISNQ